MENKNSDSSFLDNAKDFAVNAYDQTKQELSRVAKNHIEREQILNRESSSNILTSRQQEQLKKISSADDAQRFVEAAQLGGASGGQKEYEEIMGTQRKALISFGTDVAELAVGGAAVKGGLKVASKLGGSIFKGGAEAIGSKLPSLKKYSNVFKSETDLANEAKAVSDAQKAAQTAQKESEAQKKAQEYVQKQREQSGKQSAPFKSNTEKLTEKVEQETVNAPNKKGYVRETLEWMGNKALDAGKTVAGVGKWVGKGALEETASLGKTALKGGMYGAAASGIGAGIYNMLPEEDQIAAKEGAQKLVDEATEKLPGALDEAGNAIKGAIEDPQGTWDKVKKKGGELVDEYGGKIAGGLLGAYVGSNSSSPFRGVMGSMGSLMPAGNSAEATLSAMPSGGDSGSTGEGSFGSSDVSGKSAIEVLNKIYGILTRTYDVVQKISNDTSSMVRGQSQQDAARDLASSNLRARQNEGGGGGFASPVFGGGGEGSAVDLNAEDTEKSKGILGKLFSKTSAGKALKGAAAAAPAAASVGGKAAKVAGKNAGKIAKTAGVVGGAAMLSGDTDKAQYAKKFFMDKGWTEAQAAGIVGNLQGESGNFSPDVISGERRGDGGKAVGIAQWHPDRQAKFKEVMGKDLVGSSYEDQLEFVNWELNNSHKKAGNDLRKQDTAAGAAKSVEGKYEITAKSMHGGHSPERVRSAEKLMGESLPDKKETSSRKPNKKETSSDKPNKKETSSDKPEINGTKLTGDTKRNPYFGQETTPFEENNNTNNTNDKTATPYSDVPDSEKLDAPKSLIYPDSNGRMQKQDLETGEETLATDEDIKQDKAQKELEAQWVEKHKTTGSSQLQTDVDKTAQLYVAANPTASFVDKPKPTASPILKEVSDIDNRKSELKAEIEQQSLHTAYPDKESMDKDLNRLNEIYAERDKLDEKRNNIVASDEYKSASTASRQQASPQQASPQQAPAPRSNAGTGKSVPSVRNDDPTIKMMEEGNMWRTNTHEA